MEELSRDILEKWQTKKGFTQIYRHYADYVWRLSFRTVNGDHELAKEITQAVFVKLLKAMKTFRYDAAFSSWLYTITYYETLAHLRKRKKEWQRSAPLNEEIHSTSQDILEDVENQRSVADVLKTLSPEERFLLVSKEVDGFSFDELATMTGKKSGALRTTLSRLKKKIVQGGYDE